MNSLRYELITFRRPFDFTAFVVEVKQLVANRLRYLNSSMGKVNQVIEKYFSIYMGAYIHDLPDSGSAEGTGV